MIVESIRDEINISSHQESFIVSFGSLGSIVKGATDSIPSKGFIGAMDKINKSPLAHFPGIHVSDSKHVAKSVKNKVRVVADGKFKLNVGGKLNKRSSDVGKLKDNIFIDDSNVNASEIIEENLPSTYIDENSTFVLPVEEILSMFGAIHEMTVIRDLKFAH